MRNVSFVDHIEYEFQGNLCSKAIGVGDVDNDQCNELILGNIYGELHIHKGPAPEPWRTASNLGTITCVETGDVCNHGINYLVVSTLEGWCHIYHVTPDTPGGAAQEADTSRSGAPEAGSRELKAVFKQRLAANSCVIIIADIDGDGENELIIGYSDRQVRSYRWLNNPSSKEGGCDSPLGSNTALQHGRLMQLDKWQLAGQLSSMALHRRGDKQVDMMVSQPGGTFITLIQPGGGPSGQGPTTQGEEGAETASTSGEDEQATFPGPSLVYHPLGSARARNSNVSTEIIGNISRRKKGDEAANRPNYCALCTSDGTLTLLDCDRILWSLYVDHQLASLQKLDVTGDGSEEVVACSADGHTYIASLGREVARFHFQESVAAFCAGQYAALTNENVPCLIYVTFGERVRVYYAINVTQLGSSTLTDTLASRHEMPELLNYFQCDSSNREQLRQLYRWCLYGLRDNDR